MQVKYKPMRGDECRMFKQRKTVILTAILAAAACYLIAANAALAFPSSELESVASLLPEVYLN